MLFPELQIRITSILETVPKIVLKEITKAQP